MPRTRSKLEKALTQVYRYPAKFCPIFTLKDGEQNFAGKPCSQNLRWQAGIVLYHSAVRSYRTLCSYILWSLFCASLLLWSATTTAYAQSCPLYPSPHQRIGFNATLDGGVNITNYDAARLGAGWYHDYGKRTNPDHPGGILYHQMVRANGQTTPAKIQQLLAQLGPIVDANPGVVWILGNEPDRYGQDGLTAAQYARFYHDVYYFIKQRDPSSRIAIAGIVQPTPIRLRYLDLVLTEYQQQFGEAMPVEIWDIHNFILPENCSWGASIPPGLEAYQNEGIACPATLDDHGNIEIFKQQIRTFRQWMKDRGYQDRPLIVSEYGILLSQYHGYTYARVRNYMVASFNYMLNTKDSATGYPADENRLVQEFAWFSLNYYEFDLSTYFGLNGNLFDHDSRQIMPLGLDYANYTNNVTVRTIDLALTDLQVNPTSALGGEPVTLQASFLNQGGVRAEEVSVRFWAGDPRNQGQLLGASASLPQVLTGCQQPQTGAFTWVPTQSGTYTIFAELTANNLTLDNNTANNYSSQTLTINSDITATPTTTATPTPTVTGTPPAVTATPTATATLVPGAPTATPTATATLVPGAPTATPTATATLVPGAPTATPTATATLVPGAPTATPTATATLVPGAPTATPTLVLGAPTATPTVTGTTTPIAQDQEKTNFLYFPVIIHY